MTEIHYEVREKDLIAFNEHQMQCTEAVQKTMRRHQATLPSILVIISLLLMIFAQDILAGAVVGVVAALWGGLTPVYLKWNWRKQLQRLYSEEEKASATGRYTLKIEPKELVEVTAQGESRLAWKDILRIEADKHYAFVFVTLDTALIIPRATVTKGNLHEFVKQADRHITAAE